MSTLHQPVLLSEVVEALDLKKGYNVVDCTIGGGGHAEAILKKISPTGKLLGIDADILAIKRSNKRLVHFQRQVILVHDNFRNLRQVATDQSFSPVDAVLIDLGWSADQLADNKKGFSFLGDGKLDLRYNTELGLPAYELLNTLTQDQLREIFSNLGEEPLAAKLAKQIIITRAEHPFQNVADLLSLVTQVKGVKRGKIHPATKIWQALRMAVNDELGVLAEVLPQAVSILKSGGRLAVISFHSGEDRIVKKFVKKESQQCLCPPSFPVCRCGHVASLKIINKKVIKASIEELKINPRARSASLRVAQKK